MEEPQEKLQPNNELEECRKQVEEYLNNWKRERADLINYKKDEAKRMEEFAKFANESLILQLVGVIDDLIVVRNNAPPDKKWAEGFDGAMRKMEGLLKKYGLERIATTGKFDPHLHEAVEMQEGGEIMEEVAPGYLMDSKVIRPAKVRIIK